MAKTRTLPDKYYDKDYETNGIHRVPLWRIAGFALNNTATNLYLMFMNYVSFYLLGFVGVGMVMASSFTMAMRIWDGVTDPFIGYMVDKTNGKFGKNRPFMVIGNIILAASSFIMFHFTHKLPEGPARFIFFVVFCLHLLPGLHLPVRCYQERPELHDQRSQTAPHVRFFRWRVQYHPVYGAGYCRCQHCQQVC